MTRVLLISLLLCSFASYAQKASPLPETMFGVRLGSVHELPVDNEPPLDVGTLPVRRVTGMTQSLAAGMHIYFRPLTDYLAFPYIEERKNPKDKFFSTSFHLYVLPKFPKNALDLDERALGDSVKWEVTSIEWSTEAEGKDDKAQTSNAYGWASDFCRTLKVDLAREPDVSDVDSTNGRWFTCKFTEGSRELRVRNVGPIKSFRLAYPQPVFEPKNKAADETLRKLQMKAINPFK